MNSIGDLAHLEALCVLPPLSSVPEACPLILVIRISSGKDDGIGTLVDIWRCLRGAERDGRKGRHGSMDGKEGGPQFKMMI